MIKAEAFARNNPDETVKIVSKEIRISESEVSSILSEFNLQVTLYQSLLPGLELEAKWAIKNNFTDKTQAPNYLNFIHQDALRALKPEAVTIVG